MTATERSQVRATTTRLAVGQLVTWGTLYYAFAVIYPEMRADLGWSPALLSGAFSLGMLVSGLAAPAIGRRIDRAGSRRVMSLGSLTAAAGLLLWALAAHPVVFLAAWVVIGAAMAATLYEPAFATVVREHPRHRRGAILTIGLVGGLASPLFTPLTSWLADQLGWRGGLVALAGLAAATLLPHLGLPAAPRRRTSADAPATGDDAGTGSPAPDDHPRGTPRPRPAPSPAERALGQGIVIASGVATAASVHAVALLLDVGHDRNLAVGLVAGLGLAKVASRIVLASVPARLDPRRIVAVVLVLEALGLAAALAPTPTVYLFPLLFGGGWGAMAVLKPLALAAGGDVADFAYRSGRIHRAATMANAAAPLVLGAGVTWVAGYATLWVLLPAALVVGALVVTAPDRQARAAGQAPNDQSSPSPAGTTGLRLRSPLPRHPTGRVDQEHPMRIEGLSDDDIETVGGPGAARPTADVEDGDATDTRDGDAGDADGTDRTDADGTDADGTDADGTDGDATDTRDGDAADADGTDGDATDTRDGDAADADGTDSDSTDADGTDADGTDSDSTDADGTDGDATDATDGDATDRPGQG